MSNTSILDDLATFDFRFQVQISVNVKYFIGGGVGEVHPQRKKTVPHSSFMTPSRTKNKKKKNRENVFIDLNDIFFQTSVLSYIVCFYIKLVYEDIPPPRVDISEPLRSSAGKLKSDGDICPFIICFQCTY